MTFQHGISTSNSKIEYAIGLVNMMDKNNAELISDISHKIVKEIAPEELDIFDDIKEELLKTLTIL